jgi:hypothetical protein
LNIRAYAAQAAFQILDRVTLETDQLFVFQRELQSLCDQTDAYFDFTFDRFFLYDNIQRMFTDNGSGEGHPSKLFLDQLQNSQDMSGADRSSSINVYLQDWAKLSRRQTVAEAEEVFNFLDKTANASPATLHREDQQPRGKLLPIIQNNPFLSLFCPDFVEVLNEAYSRRMQNHALITVTALMRYKADKDCFPETLEALMSSDYLVFLPTDVYSDAPLVYKRTADSFLLYSIGPDLSDNQGRRSRAGRTQPGQDIVFWPVL